MRRISTVAAALTTLVLAATLVSGCDTTPVVLSGRLTTTSTTTHPAGVQVRVYTASSPQTLVASTVSDSTGSYSFRGSAIADGSYRVVFSDADWWQGAADWSSATSIAISSGTPTVVNETLTPTGGRVTGTVSDSSAAPIPAATVDAFNVGLAADPNVAPVASATSDANGGFRFARLPSGDYRLRFNAAGFATTWNGSAATVSGAPIVHVTRNSITSGIDSTLEPGSTITGSFYAPFPAVVFYDNSNFVVQVVDATSGDVVVSSRVTPLSGSTPRFTFTGLHDRPYLISTFDVSGTFRNQYLGTPTEIADDATAFTPSLGGTLDLGSFDPVGPDCDGSILKPGADLHGVDLASANLMSCDLSGANLSGADLSGADLGFSNFSGANLSGADLSDASAVGIDLDRATLTGADLDHTSLASVSSMYFSFSPSLIGVTSGGVTGSPLLAPNMALVNGYLLGGGTLLPDGADLSNATFHSDPGAATLSLDGVDATGVNLSGSTFANLSFGSARLPGLNLAGATLTSPTFSGTDLSGADFTGATISAPSGAGIIGSVTGLPAPFALRGGVLAGPGSRLAAQDIRGTDLSGVDLTGSTLAGARITGVNFAGTNLSQVNLTGAVGGGVGGTSAAYATTICPDSSTASSPGTCVGRGLEP